MEEGRYDGQVALICPTCGSNTFKFEEGVETEPIICADCGYETTREDLIEANGEIIELHIAEIGEEIMADAAKELTDSLRRVFQGNRNIQFK